MSELEPDELQLAFHEVECATYDERFGIWPDGHAARAAAREATALLGTHRHGRVLDVGCGTGYLGLGLAHEGLVDELHLVDLSPGMLGRARANAERLGVDAHLVRATAARLPYPDDSVDAVVTRGVLHHLHDVDAALREWRRVLRLGGSLLVLSEPTPAADRVGGVVARATLGGVAVARRVAAAFGRPLSAHDEEAAREHRYWDLVAMAANLHTFEPPTLRRLATDAGFEDVRARGHGLVSIAWAVAYYVAAGELPGVAGSSVARRRASRTWTALRALDEHVTQRLVPDRAMLTAQAVCR